MIIAKDSDIGRRVTRRLGGTEHRGEILKVGKRTKVPSVHVKWDNIDTPMVTYCNELEWE